MGRRRVQDVVRRPGDDEAVWSAAPDLYRRCGYSNWGGSRRNSHGCLSVVRQNEKGPAHSEEHAGPCVGLLVQQLMSPLLILQLSPLETVTVLPPSTEILQPSFTLITVPDWIDRVLVELHLILSSWAELSVFLSDASPANASVGARTKSAIAMYFFISVSGGPWVLEVGPSAGN